MTRNTMVRVLWSCLLALVVTVSTAGAPDPSSQPPAAPGIAAPGQGGMQTPQPTPQICYTYCCALPTFDCNVTTCLTCGVTYNGQGYRTLAACQAACH
jgi:hypothetical protein